MLSRLRALLYRVWRVLPWPVRVFLVRRATPSFWVGALCMVERADGALLLVRQSYRRGWGLPGGLLKRNEEPADAAAREAQEEVGLDLVLDDAPTVVVDPRSRRVDIVYRARPIGEQEPSPRSQEIVETRWFSTDDLPRLQGEAARAIMAMSRTSRPTHPET